MFRLAICDTMHVEHEIRDTAGGDKHIDSEHYSQINKEYQAQPNGKTEHSAFLELNGSQSLAKLFLAWILLLYRGSLGLDKDEATVFVLPSSLYNDESLDCEGIVSCRPSDLIPDDSTLIRDVLYAIEQKRFALVNKMQTFAENNCWYFIVSSGNVKNYVSDEFVSIAIALTMKYSDTCGESLREMMDTT